ncbi:hypothetical protein HLRTI_001055 [Halorhabdus tiamatea SARL4B]|uniref:Uncharacterized protein n=1 Tax=Halorhabdus tiamatea SARL4B TaxID=1033806 RepID=U2E4D0_9EURY|nr:hypothetical protein [Halorhabdus tiamatea]ERJ06801.1 hypothetical protein HLRTI_001055 [Halorhabdus tiamatea SARL4B]
MTHNNRSEIYREAENARRAGDLIESGDKYLQLTYLGIVKSNMHHVGMLSSLTNLKYAVVCYRVAGNDERCENIARQGILICEDVLADRIDGDDVERQAWSGLAHEHIGDLRRIAGLDDPNAYQTAMQYYESVEAASKLDLVMAWANENEFYQSSKYIAHLADAADQSIDPETARDLRSLSLTRRITFRQSSFGDILTELDQNDLLEWNGNPLAIPDDEE